MPERHKSSSTLTVTEHHRQCPSGGRRLSSAIRFDRSFPAPRERHLKPDSPRLEEEVAGQFHDLRFAAGTDTCAAWISLRLLRCGVRQLNSESPVVTATAHRPWRSAGDVLGILAGAAVFVAALAVPLDDPALVVALMLCMRGGRLILDVDY